jgi:hypothetical protein
MSARKRHRNIPRKPAGKRKRKLLLWADSLTALLEGRSQREKELVFRELRKPGGNAAFMEFVRANLAEQAAKRREAKKAQWAAERSERRAKELERCRRLDLGFASITPSGVVQYRLALPGAQGFRPPGTVNIVPE